MQFFLFVGEDTSKSFCEYPVLVIEQVTHATSASAHRTYEFVPANLIIHRGPCSYGANVPGPIEVRHISSLNNENKIKLYFCPAAVILVLVL